MNDIYDYMLTKVGRKEEILVFPKGNGQDSHTTAICKNVASFDFCININVL